MKEKKIQLPKNLDALLVSSQANITYLTGFCSLSPSLREAYLLITKNETFLLTSPLVYDLYRNRKDIKAIKLTEEKKLSDILGDFAKKYQLKKIGFEEDNITVGELKALKKKLSYLIFISTKKIVENIRICKGVSEIKNIKKACHINNQVFTYILGKIKQGVSEKQLALKIEFFIKKQAGEIAFPPIVAFSQNSSIPHYIPSTGKKLKSNSFILLDFGAKVANYCSDMTRMVFFGNVDQKFKKVYDVVLQTQQKAIEFVNQKDNFSPSDIDKISKDYIKKMGFIPYSHGLGHGVGIEIHEDPRLKVGSKDKLKTGMVFTIEPAIYLKGWGGVRIEDLVVLEKDGVEVLTKSPKNLESIVVK